MQMLKNNEIYLMILALPFVSSMIYDLFQNGMIFEFYGNWLFKEDRLNEPLEEKIAILKEELETKKLTLTNYGIESINKELSDLENSIKPTLFYKKPLGGCLKCFHIWVCIIFTLSYLLLNHLDVNLFKWIVCVGISYFILIKNHYE
jgi:hypothetical protein